MTTEHKVKIWPSYFNAVVDGSKTFELRHNDRDHPYQVGDILILREWTDVKKFTGREIRKVISYVLPANHLLADGVVALGIRDIT